MLQTLCKALVRSSLRRMRNDLLNRSFRLEGKRVRSMRVIVDCLRSFRPPLRNTGFRLQAFFADNGSAAGNGQVAIATANVIEQCFFQGNVFKRNVVGQLIQGSHIGGFCFG